MLPDTGFEHQPANAEGAGLGLERGHEEPAEAVAADGGRHVHPLELAGLGVEEPDRAAADGFLPPIGHQEGALPVAHLLGIHPEMVGTGLGVGSAKLFVQRGDQGLARGVVQVGSGDGDPSRGGGVTPRQ